MRGKELGERERMAVAGEEGDGSRFNASASHSLAFCVSGLFYCTSWRAQDPATLLQWAVFVAGSALFRQRATLSRPIGYLFISPFRPLVRSLPAVPACMSLPASLCLSPRPHCPRHRVHGVAGLRVADASVAPHIPATPIQAMCMMIGDRAAALALRDRFAKERVQVSK